MSQPGNSEPAWTPAAHDLAGLGAECTRAIQNRLRTRGNLGLEDSVSHLIEESLRDDFLVDGDDSQAAAVLDLLFDAIDGGRELDIVSLRRWIRAHHMDSGSVGRCLNVKPPNGITVSRLLSVQGSQKLVFLADWQLQQREIVLKQLLSGGSDPEKILERETQSHPLGIRHPNIIETHFMQNSEGETFLVEERLADVLCDQRYSTGLADVANLLYDVANALTTLQQHDLIHGDVKPDNIGVRDGRYVILDFGICRPAGKYSPATTPTGSLRTRPPELLIGATVDPYKIDTWALGATVFNFVCKRFPLFRESDGPPPRVSSPTERSAFEDELSKRVLDEWDDLVNFEAFDEPLRRVLERVLVRDPESRANAAELLRSTVEELQPYIRNLTETGSLSPLEELDQLNRYFTAESISTLTSDRRMRLKTRLEEMNRMPACRDSGKIAHLMEMVEGG